MGTEEQNDGLAGSPAYKLRHHAVPRKGEQPDTYRKGFFLVFVLELKHRNLLVSQLFPWIFSFLGKLFPWIISFLSKLFAWIILFLYLCSEK
jgi:hypothetical protein